MLFAVLTRISKTRIASIALALALSGCGFVHDEQVTGPYRLIAVDSSADMSLSYGLDSGDAVGRIDATVFSVGWNSRFIVAKRHPSGDRGITQFYFLDISKDSVHADPKQSVTGPLSEEEFLQAQRDLGLPSFARTIRHLE